MLGLNQTILMVLSVVIIGGLVGGGALGADVVFGLTKSELGLGVEAGVAIVALAVVLDRITQGWAAGVRGVGGRAASPRPIMQPKVTSLLQPVDHDHQHPRSNGDSMKRSRRLLLGTLALTLVLAACGSSSKPSSTGDTNGSGAKKLSGSITLAVNPWDGSAANANVAKIILEKQGMTVKLTDIDENAAWPALDSGSIDANLEVWPSGHAKDIANYIQTKKSVVDGGLIGVTGQIDWFIPTFVADAHPEFKTWEGLKTQAAADFFKTAETGSKGQFLLGDPSYVSYDADIIKNLNLPFKVVVGGGEAALITAMDNAIKDKTPLLFYFYTPQWKWADPKFTAALTKVELPAVTPACTKSAAGQGKDHKYACAYPPDHLFKAINAKLETKNAGAFDFLKKMKWTNDDQNTVTKYKNVDGMTIAAAAQKWVDDNPTVWQAWLS